MVARGCCRLLRLSKAFSEDKMIVPQKLLISIGTRQKISAASSCSALASRSALHGVEIFLGVVLTEKNVKTIFGG